MHVLEIFPKNTAQKFVPIEGCTKFGVGEKDRDTDTKENKPGEVCINWMHQEMCIKQHWVRCHKDMEFSYTNQIKGYR